MARVKDGSIANTSRSDGRYINSHLLVRNRSFIVPSRRRWRGWTFRPLSRHIATADVALLAAAQLVRGGVAQVLFLVRRVNGVSSVEDDRKVARSRFELRFFRSTVL